MQYLFVIFRLLCIISADTIWTSPMNSNDYSDWIAGNESSPPNYLPNNGDCPNGNKCWEICNVLDNNVDDYIYRIASTQGYQNITLTFNLFVGYLMDGNHEYCRFYYNLNNAGDNDWLVFYEDGKDGVENTNVEIPLPTVASNNVGLGIKIFPDGDDLACCFMSDVYLSGTPLSMTSDPTTNFPTTNSPTTNDPTTNMPTTNIPTTNNPTTNAPTTSFPTTNFPTTSIPTTIIPTANSQTTTVGIAVPTTNAPTISTLFPTKYELMTTLGKIIDDKSESFAESELFIVLVIIGCIVLLTLIMIIAFILFKKKKRYHTTIQTNTQLTTVTSDNNTKNDNVPNEQPKAKNGSIKINDNEEDTNNMYQDGDDDNSEDMYNKSEQHITTKCDDESDSDLYETMETTTKGDMDTDMQNAHEGNNEYAMVQGILEQCDSEWLQYLNMFKKHKITDARLKHIPQDDNIWEILLPEIGVRYQFKDLCKTQNQ